MTELMLTDVAPDFTAHTSDGETFSFHQHQKEDNAWHLLLFFRGAWCPVCVEDLKEYNDAKAFFEGKNVHILPISTDKKEALAQMKEDHSLQFDIICDENLEVLKQYGVFYHGEDAPYEDHGTHGEPAYFLVNEEGKIVYMQKQTSPFGRPSATEMRKIVQYISKNMK